MTTALEAIPVKTLWPFIKWLPRALLRHFFPEERLSGLIYIDLRPRHEAATVDLGPSANYTLWLQLINLSPFEVELDRAGFRLWAGGTILKSSILKKQRIRPGEITTLHVYDTIPDGHAGQIAENIEHNYFALEGDIEFTCSVRPFAKSMGHLDGIRPRIINISTTKK